MFKSYTEVKRRSRAVRVGGLFIGGGAPVSVQSMTNTRTSNIDATIKQIAILQEAGCEIVRVAVPDKLSVEALSKIKEKISIPLVADIHFDYRLAIAAIKAGCDKVRINPGNLGGRDKLEKVVRAASDAGIAIRIGVNSGSLEPEILKKYGYPSADALAESALCQLKTVGEMGFHNVVISVKASDIDRTVKACRIVARECDYPLHLGVTEAGDLFDGVIKSAAALGILLSEGIGDTIRVSLTADPLKEVQAAFSLLRALKLRDVGIEFISCPTCGRSEVDVEGVLKAVKERLLDVKAPLKVAVMGCAVNGPGEAREADIGIAGGKKEFLLFIKGEIIKKIPARNAVEELTALAREMALKPNR